MAKRVSPEDYFTKLSPREIKPQETKSSEISKVYEAINELKQQIGGPKVVYVDKPYPVEVERPIHAGETNTSSNSSNSTLWGIIAIVGIVGIVAVSIVAIIAGRRKE